MTQRKKEGLQGLGFVFCFAQKVAGAANDDFAAVLNESIEGV